MSRRNHSFLALLECLPRWRAHHSPSAQASAVDEIAKYRAALQDGNPGRTLGSARRGPVEAEARPEASLARAAAISGSGPGVVKGAYAQLPRYFADADRVMDLETRLVWCMVHAAGLSPKPMRRRIRSATATSRSPDLEALIAYDHLGVARREDERRARTHPKEAEAYRLGEKMFYYRGGTHDFACATCHGEDGKRIRLQDLPNLIDVGGRAESLHDMAGVSSVAGRAAYVPMAAVRLLPPAALPGARSTARTRRSR